MTLGHTLATLAFVALGMAAGSAHFALLGLSVRTLATPGAVKFEAAASSLRFAITPAIFLWVAIHGASPLLGTLLGFLAARVAAMRAMGRRHK